MIYNLQDAIFRTALLQFTYKQLSLPGFGNWSFLAERLKEPATPCGVWHRTNPLSRFVNTHTSKIVAILQNELRDWLDPHSMTPIAIPEHFKLSDKHVLTPARVSSLEESAREALQVVLDYMDLVAQAHGVFSQKALPCHLQWTPENIEPEWPEPDLNYVCNGPGVRTYIEAISLIMNYPGLYDGGVEFLHERTLEPAIKMLFNSSRLSFLSDEEVTPTADLPLLVACASHEPEEEIRTRLAKAIHPTLSRLLQKYNDRPVSEPLPSHCFVYGLHLSQTHVSIFVHFPLTSKPESDHPAFCQVLAAKFLISYVYYMVNSHEDLMISRWRLIIALFTILRHVHTLELELPAEITRERTAECESVALPIHESRLTGEQTHVTWDGSRVARLRSSWEKGPGPFMVPSSWIAPQDLSIDTARLVKSTYVARDLQRQLGTLVMYHMHEYLKPLPDSVLTENHASDNHIGPDYLLSSQCPRAYYTPNSRETVDVELNTSAQFFRTRDFLTMAAPDWKDANIFVANVLAGFTMYRVQWKPTVRYPFSTPDTPVDDRCVVDFALAAETIFPTTTFTVNRAPRLPLTLTSPAMLLGFRSPNLDDSGPVISEEDMRALTEAMEPHLRVFRLLREYKDDVVIQDGPPASAEPTLFCTYLKNGFLHLLAFTYGHEQSSHISSLLLDSLPLSLRCETDEDLCDRMRIVIALFTLQTEVVKISEAWGCICWPLELLVDEHEAIVEVTGQRSPSPSEAYVDDTPEWAWHDAYDYGVEDDEDFIKQEIAQSVEIVLPWLAHLENELLPVEREHLPPVDTNISVP